MGCNQDFSTKVDRVTHDSDPRKIRFTQFTNDVPSDLGTVLDMALIKTPTVIPGTPAIPGPVLSDLTGGSNPSASDVVTFRHLNAGATTITITPDGGATNLTFAVNAATIKALAIAQGYADGSVANLDLTSIIGASTIAAALGGGSFGTGVPTSNLQHGPSSVSFSGDNGTITSMSCAVSITDTSGHYQTVGPGFLIDSGGSGNAVIPFVAIANPMLILHLDITSTGVANNTVELTLTPPTTPDATAGEMLTGSSHWLITFTDSTSTTIDMNASQFVFETTAEGEASSSSATIDMHAYVPNWDTLHAGKTIDSVSYNTSTAWTTSNSKGIDYSLSSFQIWQTAANVGGQLGLNIGDSGTSGPGIGLAVSPGDFIKFTFNIVSNVVSPITISIPIAASDIIAAATPTQLAEQNNPSNDPVILPNTVLAPYVGWRVTSAVGHMYGAYGPVTLECPPSNLSLSMINPGLYSASAVLITDLTTTLPTVQNDPIDFTIENAEAYLGLYFVLWPLTVPPTPDTDGPIVMTEAYELRNRNQAAMRFIVTPAPGYDPESVWTFVARSYVSQGTTDKQEFWTPAPVVIFDESAASTPGNGVIIDALSHRPGTPPNFGGTIIELPINTAFTGPWNYWRLLLQPITVGEGGTLPDFTGWTMQIVANAREL